METVNMQELKLMLKEVLNGDIAEIKTALNTLVNSNNIMMVKVDNIEVQTEKTNGRVTKLEDKVQDLALADQKHFSSCPQLPKMDKFQEDLAQIKKEIAQVTVKRAFKARVITVAIAIVGAIGVILGILINFFIKK